MNRKELINNPTRVYKALKIHEIHLRPIQKLQMNKIYEFLTTW